MSGLSGNPEWSLAGAQRRRVCLSLLLQLEWASVFLRRYSGIFCFLYVEIGSGIQMSELRRILQQQEDLSSLAE